jgi:CheY-like chemotaxis protein/DNA-directed RNA polymerase subunit RPC12/RpoP
MFPYRILVVDDEPALRATAELLLKSEGYEVRTAADGFEALVELRSGVPDVLISDLSMPNMNGFELLSVVRRRFPQIVLIAMSGEYNGSQRAGLICDAFFPKGGQRPEQVIRRIAELIGHSPLRPYIGKPDRAPVWIPRSAEGYFVVTCTECLRSFPVKGQPSSTTLREIECIHCSSKLQFLAGVVPDWESKTEVRSAQRAA